MLNLRVDSFYKYANSLFFNLNILEFTKLYMPILSSNSIRIFMHMYSDILSYDLFKLTKKNIESLLKLLNISIDDFNNSRIELEALGLLRTYISNSNDIIFNLLPPLNYQDFISNQQIKKVLLNKIGEFEFSNLEMLFDKNEIPSFYNEITSDISLYFENEIIDVLKFDFDKLYKNLSSTTSISICIDEETKKMIDFYFSKKTFTFEQIEGFIYKSIIKKDNVFIVSYNLLANLLNENDKEIIKNHISNNIKFQRIQDLFIENCSISHLNRAYKNYSLLTSEQYLSEITSSPISNDEITIINLLRKQYNLNDKLINMMIDYSIDKTHHRLNEKYLSKIARSFKIKNINSLDEAYNYLVNWSSSNKKSNSNLSKDNINKSNNEQYKEIDLKNDFNDSINNIDETIIGDFNIDLLG